MIAQAPMGKSTTGVLDALEIAYFNPKTPEEALKMIPEAWILAELGSSSVAILLDIKFFSAIH